MHTTLLTILLSLFTVHKRARITEVCSSPSPTEQPQDNKSPIHTSTTTTPPPRSPSDHELNVEEENDDQTEANLTPENLSLKEPRPEISVKKEEETKWSDTADFNKYKMYNPKRKERNETVNVRDEMPTEDMVTPPPFQKSPVEVLTKVFPRKSRTDIEAILSRCKGDVVAAMELMITGAEHSHPYHLNPESPPYHHYQSKSAFSPLSNQSFKFSPSRRFLTPPYSGTGYLPTVIRPPPDYLSSFMPPSELMYGRQMQPSPGTSPRSDNTNNEGFSD